MYVRSATIKLNEFMYDVVLNDDKNAETFFKVTVRLTATE